MSIADGLAQYMQQCAKYKLWLVFRGASCTKMVSKLIWIIILSEFYSYFWLSNFFKLFAKFVAKF